jgi:hypothetical protein
MANPVAGFEVTPQTQSWPEATVDITNTTIGGQLAATWNMNDGNFLFDYNPGSYTYEEWGEFTIQLVVSNGACSDTTYRTIEILPPAPVANFTGPAQGCLPLTVQFNNLSENAVVSTWAFGDGNQSTAGSPIHVYQQGGTYTITLVGYRCNETDTFSLQVSTIQSGLSENKKNEIRISNISKSGLVTLEGDLHDVQKIDIINTEGKIIFSTCNISNTIPLIINNSGMYLMNIHYENFIRPIKFVFSK